MFLLPIILSHFLLYAFDRRAPITKEQAPLGKAYSYERLRLWQAGRTSQLLTHSGRCIWNISAVDIRCSTVNVHSHGPNVRVFASRLSCYSCRGAYVEIADVGALISEVKGGPLRLLCTTVRRKWRYFRLLQHSRKMALFRSHCITRYRKLKTRRSEEI